jgi:hypothetical protein
MLYGENINFNIYKLTKEYLDLVENFKCGNEEMDKYLKSKALDDLEYGNSFTRIIINSDNNELIGYYSINCTSIVMENHSHRYFSPAIEIKMFALSEKYQGMRNSENDDEDMFSDQILCEIISRIVEITESYISAKNIILYSVPKAKNFYIRNGFELFSDYMISSDDLYVKDCIPMWFEL